MSGRVGRKGSAWVRALMQLLPAGREHPAGEQVSLSGPAPTTPSVAGTKQSDVTHSWGETGRTEGLEQDGKHKASGLLSPSCALALPHGQ